MPGPTPQTPRSRSERTAAARRRRHRTLAVVGSSVALVLDYGPDALADSVALLDKAGIGHAGAVIDGDTARVKR